MSCGTLLPFLQVLFAAFLPENLETMVVGGSINLIYGHRMSAVDFWENFFGASVSNVRDDFFMEMFSLWFLLSLAPRWMLISLWIGFVSALVGYLFSKVFHMVHKLLTMVGEKCDVFFLSVKMLLLEMFFKGLKKFYHVCFSRLFEPTLYQYKRIHLELRCFCKRGEQTRHSKMVGFPRGWSHGGLDRFLRLP